MARTSLVSKMSIGGMFDDMSMSFSRADLPSSMRPGGFLSSPVQKQLGSMGSRSPGVMAQMQESTSGGMRRGASMVHNLAADHNPVQGALRRMEGRANTPLQQMMDPTGKLRGQVQGQQQAHAGKIGAMINANTPGARLGPVHNAKLSNQAAQNQDQFTPNPIREGFGGAGMTALGLGAGGLVGGMASYATGGEFGTGFAMGMGGALGGKALKRAAMNNMAESGGLSMTKKYITGGGAKGTAASALNAAATSLQTSRTRTAMMGGAGLSGVMFGGDRSSQARGFNQSRGNRF